MGQTFGGMVVGRGSLSEAAIEQPVQAAACAPPEGLGPLPEPVVTRPAGPVVQAVAADDATDATHGLAGIRERAVEAGSRR